MEIDPKRVCPKCGEKGKMYKDDVDNCLSRLRAGQVICDQCGQAEAIADMKRMNQSEVRQYAKNPSGDE